jgi:hypothetical protein
VLLDAVTPTPLPVFLPAMPVPLLPVAVPAIAVPAVAEFVALKHGCFVAHFTAAVILCIAADISFDTVAALTLPTDPIPSPVPNANGTAMTKDKKFERTTNSKIARKGASGQSFIAFESYSLH